MTRLLQAEEALRGPRETPVALRIQRANQTLDVQAVRDTLLERSVQADRLPNDIAHVRLDAFRRRSGAEVAENLDRLEAEGALHGVILDLRGNPGGLLEEAVLVVDAFVSEGSILQVRGRDEAVLESHEATALETDRSLPLVVLVDQDSASASEIVAGALQDMGRATIVGTPTYGKGSVQKLFLFDDGSGMRLTIARYHLPSGRAIPDGEGLEPDVAAPSPRTYTEAAAAYREEPERSACGGRPCRTLG